MRHHPVLYECKMGLVTDIQW